MTPRERVLRVLNHEEPDRVPCDMGGSDNSAIVRGACERLMKHLGLAPEPLFVTSKVMQTVKVPEALLVALGIDTRGVYDTLLDPAAGDGDAPDGTFVDEWGVKYRRSSLDSPDFYYEVVEAPLAKATSTKDLERFAWPTNYDEERAVRAGIEAKRLHEEGRYAVVGKINGTALFEFTAIKLRGFENFLMDMALQPTFAAALLEHTLEVAIRRWEVFLKHTGPYLDLVMVGDDLASQANPLMSPKMYREVVKPFQKRYFEFLKSRTRAKLIYHSCGNVVPLIPDLIEIGVDVLNPVQVSANQMDTAMLKREFGKDLVFWGAIDSQVVLPYGRPEEVRAEVARRIRDLAPGGGYVLSAVHNIQFDVPPENIVAMFEAAHGLEVGG